MSKQKVKTAAHRYNFSMTVKLHDEVKLALKKRAAMSALQGKKPAESVSGWIQEEAVALVAQNK